MSFFSLAPSPARDERLVLVGLTVTVVAIVAGMLPVLRRFRDTSEIKAIEPKTQYITHETEDALPLATLESLVSHYNFSIRDTAAKIVFDRAINNKTVLRTLLWGIARPDYDERTKHLQVLSMVANQNNLYLFNSPAAYSAFVRSLEQCLGSVKHDAMVDPYFDEYPLRDIAEKMCLKFLEKLACKFGVTGLVRARFVDRWLVKQPWVDESQVANQLAYLVGTGVLSGGAADRPEREANADWLRQRQCVQNFAQYLLRRDNCITDICRHLQNSADGVNALFQGQLIELRPNRRSPPRLYSRPNENANGGLPPGQLPLPPPGGFALINGLSALREEQGRGAAEAGEAAEDATAEAAERAETAGAAEATAVAAYLGPYDEEMLHRQGHELAPEDEDRGDAAGAALLLQGGDRGDGGDSGAAARQARPPSQNSQEEQRIRRQHREAMVLNDGTRPLRRGDIIERDSER